MTVLAAACGVLLVLLGLLSTGRSPTEAQFTVEIICLVGGLLLCFVAVILSRLSALARRLDGLEVHFRAAAFHAAGWAEEGEGDPASDQ